MARSTLGRVSRGCNRFRGVMLLASLVLAGCGGAEEIRHYKVPKPEILFAENHVSADVVADAEDATAPTDRLLGAIVPRGADTWYFKMTGPMDLVAVQEKAFRTLIESLAFESPGSAPRWVLPESWQEDEGTGQRQATLSVQVEGKKLEVSVIRLGTSPSPQAILDNVNRWRRQMHLAPLEQAQLEDETELLELTDGTAVLVNLIGNFSSGSMGTASLSQTRPGASPKAVPKPASDGGKSGVKYDMPANWVSQPPVTFSLLAFEVTDGDKSAKITVSALRGSAGGLLANVNRWFGQAGLPPISADDLAKKTEKLDVSGISGIYAEAIGAAGQGSDKAIVGWIGLQGGQTWFVKMSGDPQLVRAQVDTFRTFMKTLKFNAP